MTDQQDISRYSENAAHRAAAKEPPSSGSERLLVRQDRPWRDYPTGTMAHSCTGGHWLKMEREWKWNGPDGNGGTFPTPGGNACGACVSLPNADVLAPAGEKTPTKK